MGLEADSGAVSEAEEGVDGSGEAAAPAAAPGPGSGGDAAFAGPDKKNKKKRGPRGGKQQRLTGDHRKAFLRARAGDDRTNNNWDRVHCVTAQAYGPRVTKCIPSTRRSYAGGNPQGQKHEILLRAKGRGERGGYDLLKGRLVVSWLNACFFCAGLLYSRFQK